MTIQYIIITIIIAIAISYVAYKIYNTVTDSNNPCGGCKGCSMNQQQADNEPSDKKKPTCDHKM